MFKITNLKISLNSPSSLENEIAKKYKLDIKNVKVYRLLRKSIDARDHDNIYFIYSLFVDIKNFKISKYHKDIVEVKDYSLKYLPISNNHLNKNIAVIGLGPCGLFASMNLINQGFNVDVYERGKCVEERIEDVNKHFKEHKFNKESNVGYGEGGAGTFSDGKLHTSLNDPYLEIVFNEFIKYGANENIRYEMHPHIGSDVLIDVLKNIRKDGESKGIKYHFSHTLIDLASDDDKVNLTFKHQESTFTKTYDAVILAIGHNPLDTFLMLKKRGMKMEAKPFSMGVRIEHLQKDIDKANYGEKNYLNPLLPPSTYKLVAHLKNNRSVYTFCMCPGGYVVPSNSEEGLIVTNGMSYSKRDGLNANSALLVNVTPDDFNNDPIEGLYFQRKYERKAYELTNSYKAPCQLVNDFLKDRPSTKFGKVKPSYYGGVEFKEIKECLPSFVYESLKMALPKLNHSLNGFNDKDAIMSAIESRSSCPLRLVRVDYMSSLNNVYVGGEGSGYSGGITTSAIDGIKCSNAIIKKYL